MKHEYVRSRMVCARPYAPGIKAPLLSKLPYPSIRDMRRLCARYKATYEGMCQVSCAKCENPTAFQAALSLKNGYAPVMRRVLKIYPDNMKRNKAIYDGMRQVLCARCESSTAFKATLPLKNRYATVMRWALKI